MGAKNSYQKQNPNTALEVYTKARCRIVSALGSFLFCARRAPTPALHRGGSNVPSYLLVKTLPPVLVFDETGGSINIGGYHGRHSQTYNLYVP